MRVFAPHVAFDHEIHVATSHAWVSSRFRGVLVCMTPGYVVCWCRTRLLRLECGDVSCACCGGRARASPHADIPFKSPHRNSGVPSNGRVAWSDTTLSLSSALPHAAGRYVNCCDRSNSVSSKCRLHCGRANAVALATAFLVPIHRLGTNFSHDLSK